MTQDEAFEHLMGPENCLITGNAGTGKSFLLKRLLAAIEKTLVVGVTATTGIAARNIMGNTIHSYLGIGLGRKRDQSGEMEEFERFYQRCLYSPYFNKTAIQQCQLLVIDEVSMLSGSFLNDIDELLKRTRDCMDPFGGIKVVFTGDFLQLPPVTKQAVNDWAFKSRAWRRADIKVLFLTKNYRQTDPEWLQALNDVRNARISPETELLLEERSVKEYPEDFPGTFLMTHNDQAREYNSQRLLELEGDPVEFRGELTGTQQKVDQLLATITTPQLLTLKVGARVIATINDREKAYYNGSIGTVLNWNLKEGYINVKFEDDPDPVRVARFTFSDENRNTKSHKPQATMQQFPLKLAWALTIHSAQGTTLSSVFIESTHVFAHHQLYVALSRCRSLEGLTIKGFDKSRVKVDFDARRFYDAVRQEASV